MFEISISPTTNYLAITAIVILVGLGGLYAFAAYDMTTHKR